MLVADEGRSEPAACSPDGLAAAHSAYVRRVGHVVSGGSVRDSLRAMLQVMLDLCRACCNGAAEETMLRLEGDTAAAADSREAWLAQAVEAASAAAAMSRVLKGAVSEAAEGSGIGGGGTSAQESLEAAADLLERLQ
jgi:hypothetical protein